MFCGKLRVNLSSRQAIPPQQWFARAPLERIGHAVACHSGPGSGKRPRLFPSQECRGPAPASNSQDAAGGVGASHEGRSEEEVGGV